MSTLRKAAFSIQAILGILFGALLLVIPGRFLGLIGWAPVEPLLDRLLGAAFLALAWGSIAALRAKERSQVDLVLQIQIVFSLLGAVGFARHLFFAFYYPLMVWIVFAALVLFSLVWIWAYFKK